MRRILSFALAAIAVILLWAFIIVSNVYAVTDASWNGSSSITYNGNTYVGPVSDSTEKSLGLPDGAQAYTYIEPATTGTNATSSAQKINVIYFASSEAVGTATSANYKTYTYNGQDSYSNPSSASSISIDEQSKAASSKGTTSCAVEGIGWIICPVTKFLAKGMDWVFKILSGFLEVRPVGTSQDNALFRAWAYMRGFANVAFVIAFLIIIYSQMTSFGLSNYGIKKMLPRLIIAAILVNISYYVCAIAVDISNVLGFSIQNVFIDIRNSLVGSEGNSWDLLNNESIAGFVLSGGTLVTAGVVGIATTVATYGVIGSIFLLFPTLLVGILGVLVALIILAARQALITILIVLAPLAFVSYLLPNTEKWFEKWQSTFMTMLILFPAFSVIFGGSQLAAAVIIQNADSINTVILAMLVQVAPLFITPFLIKLSGSILGKVAGLVDNPNKGLIDRARKFTEDRTGNIAAKRLADPATKRQYLRRYAQHRDNKRRVRETRRKIHESTADNRFAASDHNIPLHEAAYKAELDKKGIEQKLERNLNNKIRTSPEMLRREMKVRLVTNEAAYAKGLIDKVEQELNAGVDRSVTGALSQLTARSKTATINLAINGLAVESAKRVQQQNLEEQFAPIQIPGSTEIQITEAARAATALEGERGALRIQAQVKSTSDKRDVEDVSNMVVLMESLTSPAPKIDDSAKWLIEGLANNDIVKSYGAIEELISTGNAGKMELEKVLLGIENGDDRTVIKKIKNFILKKGIKTSSIVLDKWAIDEGNASVSEVAQRKNIFANLNAEELAGQTITTLRMAADIGAITQEKAQRILDNPNSEKSLSDGTRKFFYAIANGQPIPPTDKKNGAP